MKRRLSLPNLVLTAAVLSCLVPIAVSFIVIPSDSGLVDAPQNGLKDGAQTDAREQEAIYDIMRATGNDWAADIADVCRGRWHGIECMPDKGDVYHVVSLSFGALSDDTAFPTCDPARVLDLHKNNLNGSIPGSLGRVTGLRSLDLSGNRLTGLIPGFSFPSLSILDMNQNLLTGPIPSTFGTCPSLIKIDLSHNRITGPIPDSINHLRGLILLDLSYNRLSGPFPESLRDMTGLEALIMKGNRMESATIPNDTFAGMNALTILALSDMNLHGPIPESLGRLPSLRVLHLDRNQLNGSIPGSFRNLKGIAELRLNDNHLAGPIPLGREMVWRMRRKLRLHNNSGLCYDAGSGFEHGSEYSYDSGIGLCDAAGRSGSARTVRHVSEGNDGDATRTVEASPSVEAHHRSLLVLPQLLITLIVLAPLSS
ncbi:uncharacterized protein J3R85_005658 [Psidium guajava]|nr:uncharacterized protein J3R85_005658 [Psidium guajava]